jgi:glycogen operon protein
VSYAEKHNEANGEENRDGHSENFTANWGVEGASDDLAVNETRERVKRAILATLFFSHGTPMLLAGDELSHSQNGNNNAYCQDNEITWIDWDAASLGANRALNAYVSRLIALRREHPNLRSDKYMHSRVELIPGLADVGWFDIDGQTVQSEAWNDPERRTLALRRACRIEGGGIDITLVLMNAAAEPTEFVLPEPTLEWKRALDSADPGIVSDDKVGGSLAVAARSVVLLVARIDEPPP